HDVGKIVIPDVILNKPGELTEAEIRIVREHAKHASSVLSNIRGTEEIVRVVRHHHEHYNGRGYPNGLTGDEIPLMARILAVADAFDAMYSERPYRSALPLEEIFSRLEQDAGEQFDPGVVKVFVDAVKSGIIDPIERDDEEPQTKETPISQAAELQKEAP
ncbi:unnamed protein product, partial [marine sediment metagenome]